MSQESSADSHDQCAISLFFFLRFFSVFFFIYIFFIFIFFIYFFFFLFKYVIWNNPRARPSHSAHLSITGQLKWSWGGPLFEIKALLGFRGAGGIPTLVAFSSLIRTLRITGVSVITICRVPSIIRSFSWTATGPRCTWAGGLSWIHVTWNIDFHRIIQLPHLPRFVYS